MKKLLIYCAALGVLTACQPHLQKQGAFSSIQEQFYKDADKAFAEGDYKKAAENYSNLVQNHPSDLALQFKYAESSRMANNTDKSLEIYNAILAIKPDDLDAMEGKGLAFIQKGEFENAEELFSHIVNTDGSRWRTINALGVINALQGEMEEAKIYYDMAIAVDPQNPSILNNIGLSMALSGRKQEAVSHINEALGLLSPTDIRRQKIELNLALAYGMTGHMDEAEEILRKYLEEPAVYNNLGLYANLNKDNSLARSYLSKALASHPVHYDKAWDNLQAVEKEKK
jgi:Flp pilus assembly protein TadD